MRTLRPTAGFLAVVGVAAGLGLFCWVILTPPDGSCGAGVLQDTLDAYRAIVVPAHLLALLVLGGVVAQMSRLSSGRVSRGTAIAAWSAIVVLPAHLGVLLWHTNPYFCFF
jgi:hypothetical protein